MRDLVTGTTERMSVSSSEAQANDSSRSAAISADGRFVAFASSATNLVAGDTMKCSDGLRSNYNCSDVFVRDRVAGTTERVSVASSGAQAHGDSSEYKGSSSGGHVATSADGRFVTFDSNASNLAAGDKCVFDNCWDVFVRDRLAKATERVSMNGNGTHLKGDSFAEAISADGRFVVFTNEVTSPKVRVEVFVRDRVAGTTERVSVGTGGAQANAGSLGDAISADGRFVVFESRASNLVAGDTQRCVNWAHERYKCSDVFVRDRVAGTTERVSLGSGDAQANADSLGGHGSISADGRFVAFDSTASNLVGGDTNTCAAARSDEPDFQYSCWDEFVRDRMTGTTERVSVGSGGAQGNADSGDPAISADGRVVAFDSEASNMGDGGTSKCVDYSDAYECLDVFVRDRVAGTTALASIGHLWAPQAGRLARRPWPARAGEQFTATMPVLAGGSTIVGGKVVCAATLAGRKLLAGTHVLSASSARCVWRIPKTAGGELLRGSVSVITPSGRAGKQFAGRVR